MKHIITILLTFLAISLSAQEQEKEVTQFMGIPVDGTKSEMIQKLKEKGYNLHENPQLAESEWLQGEFNGRDVEIGVSTNKNKVYRVIILDKNFSNESEIKTRFNNLCYQFEHNSKYIGSIDQKIPDKEDISTQMGLYNKTYLAIFYQKSINEQNNEDIFNRIVWFKIFEENYGKYSIAIYYDNMYNQANGEDL